MPGLSEKVVGAVGPATDAVFRLAARLRGARAFHPRGVSFAASAQVRADAAPTAFPTGEHRAIVRFSRGAGLPDPLPDVLGIGVRLVDAAGPGQHQDLLMASTGSSVVGRRLLRPGRSFANGVFSTILPYDAGGERVLFGARVTGAGRVDLDDISDPLMPGHAVELLCATPSSDWQVMGHVQPDARLPDDDDRRLGLDPFQTVGGVVPVGLLNELRRPAYGASRAGRAGALRATTASPPSERVRS